MSQSEHQTFATPHFTLHSPNSQLLTSQNRENPERERGNDPQCGNFPVRGRKGNRRGKSDVKAEKVTENGDYFAGKESGKNASADKGDGNGEKLNGAGENVKLPLFGGRLWNGCDRKCREGRAGENGANRKENHGSQYIFFHRGDCSPVSNIAFRISYIFRIRFISRFA